MQAFPTHPVEAVLLCRKECRIHLGRARRNLTILVGNGTLRGKVSLGLWSLLQDLFLYFTLNRHWAVTLITWL